MKPDDESPEKRIEALRRRIALNPNHGETSFLLGCALFEHGEYEKACPHLYAALKGRSTHLKAARLLVRAYEHRGLTDRAARLREILFSTEGGDNQTE